MQIENWARMLKGMVLCGVMAFAGTVQAEAQQIARMAIGLPEGNIMRTSVYEPWVKDLNEALAGEVVVELHGPPFGDSTKVWERVSAGVAEAGIPLLGNTGLPFARTFVSTLPGTGGDAAAVSAALWKLYERGLLEDEFDDVKLMNISVGGSNTFMSIDPITSIDQLKGLKVRVLGKTASDLMSAVGASPIDVPFPDLFQSFQSGLVQALTSNSTGVFLFGLEGIVKHQISNLPFGTPAAAIILNKEFYEGLSPKAKAAFDEFTGLDDSVTLAKALAMLDEAGYAGLVERGKFTRHEISDEELERWQPALASVRDAWVERTPNGQAILDAYLEEYKAAAGK